MKSQRLLLMLTTVNLAILVFQLTWKRTVEGSDVPPILRGHGLELVDDEGRVRAEIKVLPPSPARKADGSLSEANGEIYPETVQFRLFSSSGGPNVKLTATEDGSGLVLSGAPGYVQILSRPASKAFPETGPFVKLAAESGRKHVIVP